MEIQTVKNQAKKEAEKVGAKAGNLAMGFIGDAINVGSAIGTYNTSRKEGDNFAVSVLKGGTDFILGEIAFGAATTLAGGLAFTALNIGISTAGNLAFKHLEHNAQMTGRQINNLTNGLGSGHFDMTQSGYTMRQRSLNAIRSNGTVINSAFGNEARNYYLNT